MPQPDYEEEEENGQQESTAIILCLNIVGFTQYSVTQQIGTIDSLKKELASAKLASWQQRKKILLLPTSDGLAMAIPIPRTSLESAWRHHIKFLKFFLDWAENNQQILRAALHFGPITLLNDVNNQENITGDTINTTFRMMHAADPGQILVHEKYVQQFMGKNQSILIGDPEKDKTNLLTLATGRECQLMVQHGEEILLRPATISGGLPLQHHGHLDDPQSAWRLMIKLTQPGQPITQEENSPSPSFWQRLTNARAVSLVQLTSEHLLDRWDEIEQGLPRPLERLWLFMPHPEMAPCFTEDELNLRLPQWQQQVDTWQSKLTSFQQTHPNCDVRLALYRNPPYFSGTFIDWDEPGGFMHIRPNIWGIPALRCPGFDMEWMGKRMPPAYASYVRGLLELYRISQNLLHPTDS